MHGSFRASAALAFVTGWCLAGCELVQEPDPLAFNEDQVAVYALLEAGADSAHVLVVRYRADLLAFEPGFEPVTGAEVGLTRDGVERTLPAAPSPDACFTPLTPQPASQLDLQGGCYGGALARSIESGERVQLVVRLPEGGVATGAAVVPAFPVLDEPAAEAHVSASGFELAWAASAGAAHYEALVLSLDSLCSTEPVEHELTGARRVGGPGAGTARLVLRAECRDGAELLAWDSIPARLVFAAYDTAYAAWAEHALGAQRVRLEEASPGLEGTTGVFGAMATTHRDLIVIP